MTAVSVNHLFKSYGKKIAVKDLSFSINTGEILGLIGPNGAGKSSTIKIILDFMKPDSGEVKVFDQQMNETSKNNVNFVFNNATLALKYHTLIWPVKLFTVNRVKSVTYRLDQERKLCISFK